MLSLTFERNFLAKKIIVPFFVYFSIVTCLQINDNQNAMEKKQLFKRCFGEKSKVGTNGQNIKILTISRGINLCGKNRTQQLEQESFQQPVLSIELKFLKQKIPKMWVKISQLFRRLLKVGYGKRRIYIYAGTQRNERYFHWYQFLANRIRKLQNLANLFLSNF